MFVKRATIKAGRPVSIFKFILKFKDKEKHFRNNTKQ